MRRSSLSLFLSFLGVLTSFQYQVLFAQDARPKPAPDASVLKIIVIAGQGAVNTLKSKAAVQPIIEVRDKNNLPVPGAVVNFTAPRLGPSATFSNGGRTQSLVSDTNGRVAILGMAPDGAGTFKLTVTASYDRHFATAEIAQTNQGRAQGAGLSRGALAGILAGVGAAAAVGITLGLRGSSSGTQASSIGVGNPVVGAPH
ncbi:MAG: hypothetical protein WB992_11790 [Bryobacteraceae bacterium]